MKPKKNWKSRLGLIVVIIIALCVLFLKVPLYYQARSYLTMYAYSKYENKNSLMAKQGITFTIPGGSSTKEKDWYPFTMVFNDDTGISSFLGRELSLTVLYNFGSFSWNQSSSDFFQDDSPYFASFYGGYLVKDKTGKKFGFLEQGDPNLDEIFSIPQYDYKHLVIESLGCPSEKLTMDVLSYNLKKNVQYAGYHDWVQIDSFMQVNSPNHKYRGDRRAYIQFGNPLKKLNQEDFRLITAYGRLYVRYFPEFQDTVFLYVMSPDSSTIQDCDNNILSKTTITKNT
ncbi:MAG: hypothetical protein AWM53_00118 [Candidatus Dichloromethanomonas elyunquensis]|nr:MAG: hypothetical protein AWM53_00118 [Candidatus Dichloromethanomonas elyunquensis]